jgi:hypothetical protein
MSSNNYFYARLKTRDPKRGFGMSRYHFAGNLFQGGPQPTWYRVDTTLAELCSKDTQDNGQFTFDVVDEAQKLEIDAEEERRRLVSLGLLSATVAAPRGTQVQDIRSVSLRAPGRFDAIPGGTSESTAGVVTTREFGLGAK